MSAAANALLKTAIELLKKGDADNGLYGRMIRLTGQGLFALGRSGFGTLLEAEMNRDWLRASGDDLERDGLLQIQLRSKVIEFKNTKDKYFKSIFHGKSSLLLHKAAREFFRDYRSQQFERDRIVCMSLGLACLLLAENRYSSLNHSIQELLEQNSAVKEIIKTEEDLLNFSSLAFEFEQSFERFSKQGGTFNLPDTDEPNIHRDPAFD